MGIESSRPQPLPEGADPDAKIMGVPLRNSSPFTFNFDFEDPNLWKDKTVEPWYWAVKPGMDQLLLEVDQIAVGAKTTCCLEYCIDRICCCSDTRDLDSVKMELIDKGWLERVNAHLRQHGRVADLLRYNERVGNGEHQYMKLRIFKLANHVQPQEQMAPHSGVPGSLVMQ